MSSSDGYSVNDYGGMVRDFQRMQPFARALRNAVKPDSVVLEIGTGTGLFALLACRYGARKVYAIEPDASIEVGRRAAAANGYADRIEWFQAMSSEVQLPERADVLISDLRGILPLYRGNILAIADARRRLLKPDAIILPRRDLLRIAPVESESEYRRIRIPWESNDYGLDLRSGRDFVANGWWRAMIKREELLADPETWLEIDYTSVTDPNMTGSARWSTKRAGTLRGFCMWFDMDIDEGNGFSNGPDRLEMVYGRGFIPILHPVELAPGDRIEIAIQANLVSGDYLLRWQTRVDDAQGQQKASFRQSTFDSRPLDPAALKRIAEDHVPSLTPDGRLVHEILQLMEQGATLGAIARQVVIAHPDKFADYAAALDRVSELSSKYSL